jgi:outer membrane protein insertion porin family
MFKIASHLLLVFIFLVSHSYANIFNQINVTGNERISKETILVLSNLKTGINYDDNQLNQSFKNLFQSNFFKDINFEVLDNVLNISIVENPIIEDLEISGIKNKNIVELINNNIVLKNRKSFVESDLLKDVNNILNILKSNGYYFAKVDPVLINNDELNSIRLEYKVELGDKAKIKKIKFIGDKKIKDKKLLEIIASEEHKFWKFISNSVYLNEQLVELDKRLLENYYKNQGYYQIQVLDSFGQFDNSEGLFELIFNISAGEKFYFNEFALNLPEDYDPNDFDKINKLFKKLEGKRYSINDFNELLEEIDYIASFKLYDFIDATVDEKIIDNNKLNFTFNINDAKKFYVEKINILGNYVTIEEVIRNKLIVDEGDPLNNILYNKSIDNIRSLGIFKNVKAEIKDGSDLNSKEIDIIVEEKPTGEISLSAGVGTSGSTIGGGIKEKNFLGKGIDLSTNLEVSEDSVKGEFIYSKPNFAYTDNTLSTSIRSTTTDYLTDFGYKVSNLGFSLGTSFEQYENLFFNPEIDLNFESLTTNSSATNTLKKQEGSYEDLYFNYGLIYDLRDSAFNPSKGNRTSFNQTIPLYSETNELINIFTFTQYKELNRSNNMIGKASLYLKNVNSVDGSDVRISKRGQIPYSRLRGFERGKVGPIDGGDYIGGNYVSALNLSTNIPTFLNTVENIDFLYFIDIANVWGVDYSDNIDDSNQIRSSTGIGIELLTPIGPLSFSFTQPITKKSSDKTETFRFNLGTTF